MKQVAKQSKRKASKKVMKGFVHTQIKYKIIMFNLSWYLIIKAESFVRDKIVSNIGAGAKSFIGDWRRRWLRGVVSCTWCWSEWSMSCQCRQRQNYHRNTFHQSRRHSSETEKLNESITNWNITTLPNSPVNKTENWEFRFKSFLLTG